MRLNLQERTQRLYTLPKYNLITRADQTYMEEGALPSHNTMFEKEFELWHNSS